MRAFPWRAAYRRFVAAGEGCAEINRKLSLALKPTPAFSAATHSCLGFHFATAAPTSARLTLDELISEVCRQYGMKAGALAARSHNRDASRLRALMAHRATRFRIATLSDVARKFAQLRVWLFIRPLNIVVAARPRSYSMTRQTDSSMPGRNYIT